MKLLPFLLALIGFLPACSSKPEDSTSAVPNASGVAVASPAPAAAPSTRSLSTVVSKTIYQMLQGKWQSTQDAKSVIEIKGHLYTDYYDGKQLDTAAFILDKACPSASGAGHPGDDEKYLVQPKQGMCWEVINVDGKSLELSYTARGNTLNYQKVQ